VQDIETTSYRKKQFLPQLKFRVSLLIFYETVKRIIRIVQNYDKINIALQFKDEKHAFRFPLEYKEYKRWGIAADEVLTLNQTNNMEAVKILIFYSSLINSVLPIDEKLVSELKLICTDNAQFYMADKGTCVQVMGKNISKFSGIEKIRERYGFKKDEIAVFGDDTNDMEMLMEYPFSINPVQHSVAIFNIKTLILWDISAIIFLQKRENSFFKNANCYDLNFL